MLYELSKFIHKIQSKSVYDKNKSKINKLENSIESILTKLIFMFIKFHDF